ncbi:hypothetical protein KAJ83_03680 [Marivibrio halodurans]|uniref:O-GlcNAc transferase C-terminal domain-containing protein n=1 Tax=Marivibrio halodurans TaxID=2039722 RepID=A0A8J7V195_9PROT|nr:hypothetical protein [Marivibrio halodurans]MBP5856095.1 hypothetical protein [Marivibrio halodurans]
MATVSESYKDDIAEAIDGLSKGETDRAISIAESVLKQHGNVPEAVYVLGLVAARMDEPARTLELLKLAHDLSPNCQEFADALAIAYAKLGRLGDSLFYGKIAATLAPHPTIRSLLPEWFGSFEEAFLNISEPQYARVGDELLGLGNADRAVEMYRREAEARGKDPGAWRTYAMRLMDLGRVVPALMALRKISEMGATTPIDEARTAGCLGRAGRLADMRDIHEAMLTDGRVTPEALSQMLADIARDPGADRAYIAQAERIYAEIFPVAPDDNLPSRAIEKGALKVGLVTSRFSLRGGLDFLWPLLSAHGFANILIYVYANDIVEDSIARRVQGTVASWIDAREIDDLTLDTIIRNDGIHLLIDLDGHMPGGRPQLFMRRPAPAAIRLGGLPESAASQGFDAVLGDAAIYPEAEDALAEDIAILRVDGGIYRLPILMAEGEAVDGATTAPEGDGGGDSPGGLLALSIDQAQIDDALIAALGAACAENAALRLLVPADLVGGKDACSSVEAAFAGTGAEGRFVFTGEGTSEAAKALAEADAVLQLGPCWSAGVAEALTAGRPVFTARGRVPGERMTDSLLIALGLSGMIAETPTDAVAMAARAAGDGAAAAEARARLSEAGTRSRAPDFLSGWGEAMTETLMSAYRALAQKGDAV